jgi:hypothetical protein
MLEGHGNETTQKNSGTRANPEVFRAQMTAFEQNIPNFQCMRDKEEENIAKH